MTFRLLALGLVVVTALVGPGKPASAPSAPSASLAQQCAETGAWLKRQLGAEAHVLVRPPLVLGGDLSSADLDRWHREVLQPAAHAMATTYFKAVPDCPIVAVLMANEETYRRAARRLFGDTVASSSGYYKPHLHTMLVNVGQGRAGMLHELTHALASFDFPDAPTWLSEGLASLHEDCLIQPDPPCLLGRDSGRLAVLREALAAGRTIPLADLLARGSFQGPDEALCYAQARFFCLYLQRRGRLGELWAHIRTGRADDPSGAATVARIVAGFSWDRLEADFRQFLQSLTPGAS